MFFLADIIFYFEKRENLPPQEYRIDAIFNKNEEYWCIRFINLDVNDFDKVTLAKIRFLVDSHYNEIEINQRFKIMEGRKCVGEGIIKFINIDE